MPVDLSIKQVDDAVAERLRERAKRNHRSLQGELKAILEEAAGQARLAGKLSVRDLYEWSHRAGIDTPDEATGMVREDRDARSR